MVNHKKPIQLGQKTVMVMVLTMLSRLGGFLRDILLAVIFGASGSFDAFVIAFKIPNLIRRLFGEGAFAQAIVPTLAHQRTHYNHQEINQFINQLTGLLTIITFGIVVIGEIIAPIMVIIFAPGFLKEPARFHLTVDLIRITQPYLLTMSLVALSGAILNTYHRFAITAFTPVLLNVTLILVAYFLAPLAPAEWKIYLLAGGVLLGGLFQLLIQWPVLKKLGFRLRLEFNWKNQQIRAVCWGIAPAVLGVSVSQICLLIDNLFASFLPTGSISWLYYADRLIYLPLGVIGVAIATVVLPHLAHHHQRDQAEDFSLILDWGLRSVILIAMPAAIGLFILAGPILATLLHHGAFTERDVQMTRLTLMAFSVGLPAWMIIKVLASAFYSSQNISLPAKIGIITLIINIILNFMLIKPMAQTGLALATSIASWFNAVLLWIFLRRKIFLQTGYGWIKLVRSIFLANMLMAMFLIWQTGPLSKWLAWSLVQGSWRLLSLIGLGIMIYLFGLWISGLRWRHCRPPRTESSKVEFP